MGEECFQNPDSFFFSAWFGTSEKSKLFDNYSMDLKNLKSIFLPQ